MRGNVKVREKSELEELMDKSYRRKVLNPMKKAGFYPPSSKTKNAKFYTIAF